MRFIKPTLSFLFFVLFFIQMWAQKPYSIKLENRAFIPLQNVEVFDAKESLWQTHIYQNELYVVLQFGQLPKLDEQEKLKEIGIFLFDYLPNNAYTAKLSLSVTKQQLQAMNVRAVFPMQAIWKLSANLQAAELPEAMIKGNTVDLLLSIPPTIDKAAIEKELAAYGTLLEARHSIRTDQIIYLNVEAKQERILALASLAFIANIQLKPSEPHTLTNGVRATQRTNVLGSTFIGALNLLGTNVLIGVGDAGTINEHIDLENRILNAYNIDENAHGAKVTGIIAGEGILSPTMQGVAPQSEIIADIFTNTINSTGTYYNNLGMVLTNNSYGTSLSPLCSNAGDYNGSSRAMDQIANTYPNVLHCLAAGNDGDVSCTPYPAGFGTVFQGLQSAKNIITIGSVDAYDMIADDSSQGPTQDGRTKPDLVGVGVDVSSPNLSNLYSQGSGTSFAAPAVTGTFALLWEHYRNQNSSANPSAALMKAIACATADDLGNPGPDFTHGFGRINGLRAANVITAQSYLDNTIGNTGTAAHSLNIPANTAEVRVLLYWQDKEASPSANPALVNNLDLSLDAPNGTTYLPWILDATPANVQNDAVRGIDNRNNIEQITLEAPAAGMYTIDVAGTSIPSGTQQYHLVYEVIPEHVQLTHPIGGESFSPNEELLITWDAGGYNSQTFSLAYSLNNGGSWINIDTNVPGTARQYSFSTPNLTSTNTLVRIIRNGTSLASGSNSVFHILGVPTGLSAAPACDGTINLSWSAVSGASSYKVYEYQLGSWSLVGNTATNSFSLSGRTAGENYCYTVRTNYGGGLLSRSAFGECVVAYGTAISSFPYQENFEASNGNWFTRGKNTDWAWGTPSGTIINTAASGTKAWSTNLSGDYSNASETYLYSPCFDLSSLVAPALSFSFIYEIENNASSPTNPFDIAKVEYSLNGKTWTRLGVNGGGTNWYSNVSGGHHWDGQNAVWHTASYAIPTNNSRVQFRLLLDADQYGTEEGIGLDDICITESGSSCELLSLQLKTMLKGSFNSATGLMKDDLRQDNLVPLSEPYTASGYVHIGGGSEMTTAAVLGVTGSDAIVDWVVIEVRDGTSPTTVIATRAALLQADGDIVDVDGVSAVTFPTLDAGNYYVAIRHRNHLGTMTEMPVSIGL